MLSMNEKVITQMYSGEEKRDASSKVRGFLFQDLIAIEELLSDETDYLCCEYIEDVFINKEDGIKIIQAKYYPQTDVNIKEVLSDLYYQYLRLKNYGYEGEISIQLSMHSKKTYNKPSYTKMVSFLGLSKVKKEHPKKDVTRIDEICRKKKSAAKTALFKEFAYKKSIESFLGCLNIRGNYKCIGEYRDELSFKLDRRISHLSGILDENIRKKIVMGLSIQYIERSYNDSCEGISVLENRKRSRIDFLNYLQINTMEQSEENIVAYLQCIIVELWTEILEHNEGIPMDKVQLMNKIVRSTSEWIAELCSKVEGQYKLINTISRKNGTIEGFQEKNIKDRITVFKEQREPFEGYLKFFWKIILCINFDSYANDNSICIDVNSYIDNTKEGILGVRFIDTESNAILFSGTDGNGPKICIKNVFERVKILRPEVWYWKGPYSGNFFYEHNVSEIYSGNSVSSLLPNTFRLECLKCIKVDEDDWKYIDDCKHTIFCNRCVKERKI